MNLTLRLTVLVIGGAFSLLSIYLLVKKRNNERNTVLWLAGLLLTFGLSAYPSTLNRLSRWLGVDYPPSLLFLVAIIFLLFIVLNQSIQISTLNVMVKEIGQEMALLKVSVLEGREAIDPALNMRQRSAAERGPS